MAIGYKLTREISDCKCFRGAHQGEEVELLYREIEKGQFELIDPSLTCDHAEEIESEYFTARKWVESGNNEIYNEHPHQEEIDQYLEQSDALTMIQLLLDKEQGLSNDRLEDDIRDMYALLGSEDIISLCKKFNLEEDELRELYEENATIF